ncbi:MAG: carbohydrate ABC transporter permease [Clostridia bacterium]|nr:carbohydrate ABC transporter permease [Clostridia bacterium]
MKMRIKESKSYKIFRIFNTLLMLLLAVVFLFPYLNTLAKAFNDSSDTLRGGITIYPRAFSIENFKILFADSAIPRATVISVSRVAISVVLSLLVQFGAAYALSKKMFPGKKLFVGLYSIPMFIAAGQVPLYVLISKMGLLNNFWVYIFPGLFSFYNVVIIRTFIQNTIPSSVEESALIDGATEIRIFFQIILPLSTPILATIALWVMVAQWNDWTTTLYYIRNSKLYTLQYIMMELVKESERIQKMQEAAIASGQVIDEIKRATSSEGLIAAQVIVTTFPIICVYPFLQKYFVKGIMVGSVKG